MDVVMPGQKRLPGDARALQGRGDQEHPGHHLHEQEPGDRQGLGPAPGRERTTSTKPVNGAELLQKIKALG